MNNTQNSQEDHPTARLLFYLGYLVYLLMLFLPDSLYLLIVAPYFIICLYVVEITQNFRNWNIFSADKKVRLFSAFAIIPMLMGGILIFGTIFGLPWLINGIRSDLRRR